MAIGSYVATPLEMAGAYTVFANGGIHVQPTFLSLVKEPGGKVMLDQKPEKKAVLDPRVDAVLVDMLQEVMRSGTAAGVHGRGFNVIAAGKTGTDPTNGWFAGFTSDLLCIVWVGFDDNRPLEIEGAHSALPVWTEFMKRAITLKAYSNPRPFEAPDGVVTVSIDSLSGMRSTPSCPQKSVQEQVFVAGSEPVAYCTLHGGKGTVTTVSAWDTTPTTSTDAAPTAQTYMTGLPPRRAVADAQPAARKAATVASPAPAPRNPTPTQEPKKKGLFDHIKDIFR
jgi:penicillin-binding protein 1B